MTRGRKSNGSGQEAGGNGPTDEQAAEIVAAIEEEYDGLLHLQMDYMRECKPFHERIKDIVDRGVKVYGMNRKAIRAKVKERGFRRKADAIRAKLDEDDMNAFDMLSEQMGELGKAARRSYEKARSAGEEALTVLAGRDPEEAEAPA